MSEVIGSLFVRVDSESNAKTYADLPTLVMDLDGTMTNGEYPYDKATPRHDVIAKVNEAYDAGWRVIVFTARGMNRFADMNNKGLSSQERDFCGYSTRFPVAAAAEEYGKMTYDWLVDNGVKFHHLRFGKPAAVYYVDDKSLTPEGFLGTDLQK